MSATELLSRLAPDSMRLFTETRIVRLDQNTNPEIEQTYLTIDGTPDGYRWLATMLTEMANNADRNEISNSVITSPPDLKQITMTEWSSIELVCRPSNTDSY